MDYKEILIDNPITLRSINTSIDEIQSCNSSLLIINIGAHNFEKIEVMKKLKNRLDNEKKILRQFKKKAFFASD